MRLLIAEDERELAKALKTIFEKHNYSVDTVFDGQAALDYALTENYDGAVPEVISFEGLSLDLSAYTLSCGERSARLGNREFQMMEMLMETPRRIISTSQFMERVWGWDAEVDVSIVWVYVSNLRKKIAQLGAKVEIRATRGVGYSLEAKA